MIWHYPNNTNNNINTELREKKEGNDLILEKDFSWRLKSCSYLYPSIFIIDFDHTLAVYDSDCAVNYHHQQQQ